MVLDHDTRSVVVSVRGSVSTADWVTDFLGIPELLEEWLPDAFKEVCILLYVSYFLASTRQPRGCGCTCRGCLECVRSREPANNCGDVCSSRRLSAPLLAGRTVGHLCLPVRWLVICDVQEHPDLGPCFAHSGILAAAKAVWADLEEHGILEVIRSSSCRPLDGKPVVHSPVACGMSVHSCAFRSR